nr:recombinase family protein [Nakamurella antarctica]
MRYIKQLRIGYGRVSTRDQHPEAQYDALTAAGCDEIYLDKASAKLARRPQLDKAALLSANRAGDQIVITKLDRLGRSLDHLLELSKQLQDCGIDLSFWTKASTPPPQSAGCSSKYSDQ